MPLCWTGKWTGMEYEMDYGIYIFHSNTQLYCVAICYTNLLIASSSLYWPAFMEPPRSCRGQRSCAIK